MRYTKISKRKGTERVCLSSKAPPRNQPGSANQGLTAVCRKPLMLSGANCGQTPRQIVPVKALGLEEAFAASVEREIAVGLSVRVVTAPALVVLKIVAYQDRPHERSKDLADLVEEAGAYLLGVDTAQLARPKSRAVIRAFLTRLTDEYAELVSRVLAEEKRTHSESRRSQVYRLFRVFDAGFRSG